MVVQKESAWSASLSEQVVTLMRFVEYAHDGSPIPRGSILVAGDVPGNPSAAAIETALKRGHLLWNHLEEEASLDDWETIGLRVESGSDSQSPKGRTYLLTADGANRLAEHAEFLAPRGNWYRARFPMMHASVGGWLEEYHGVKVEGDHLVDVEEEDGHSPR